MSEASASRARILVVDDNEQNRALVEATVEAEGHEAILAAGGEEGIAAFDREKPDCVLLDVRMPRIDGFAVCKHIRASPGGADVPVIFLTALRDVETFDRALAAGADDFLTKPVLPTELAVRLHAALEIRRLGAELREHYALIRRQRDDLMRLQLQKEMLMAFVVHDLKNPVGAMDLLAQSLIRDRSLPAEARETAALIRGSARQLGRLVQNLLDLSKSEEGKLVPRIARVDLRTLAADVREGLSPTAAASKVDLALAIEAAEVTADPDLLRRVLENLVENAIRHAPRGTAVTLSSAAQGGGVELRVTDRGAGIPPEAREQVFARFVQLDHASPVSSRAGRGLGLAFCKIAVEAHGGTIWIEDAGPGAAMCLRLPA